MRFFKGMVFGPYGHGKTVLLSTAQDDPRTSPVCFVDFEGGVSSIEDRNISIKTCRTWEDFNEVYEMLQGDHEYKSVVIDSISEVNTMALLAAMAGRRGDQDIPQIADYGRVSIQMRRFIRRFRDLPMHVVFAALAKSDTDPREGSIVVPQLTGQLSVEVPGSVDLVGYLGIVEDEGEVARTLILRDYPKFRTKVRAPVTWGVPAEIVNPTVGKMLDVLRIDE